LAALSLISGSATTEDKTAQKREKNICDWVATSIAGCTLSFSICLPIIVCSIYIVTYEKRARKSEWL
jgi:hypothetical protein